jgi:hypothetical protein
MMFLFLYHNYESKPDLKNNKSPDKSHSIGRENGNLLSFELIAHVAGLAAHCMLNLLREFLFVRSNMIQSFHYMRVNEYGSK